MLESVLMKRAPVIVAVLRTLSRQDAARAAEEGADALELRIDLLGPEDQRIARITEFLDPLPLPIIVTNRNRAEGGAFSGTEHERLALLRSILDAVEVHAVDVEFFSSALERRQLIAKAQERCVPVICSFHDFAGMRSRYELLRIVTCMHECGGSIAKIALTPQSLDDTLMLLEFTHELTREGKRIAMIGMGSFGRHLRVIAPLYGSLLTYGYLEGEQALAPGQLSVRQLRHMLEALGVKAVSS
ncbi:MAG TPA: type I 3-dehydroquinate dehydratase [Methanomicrobia archaeon]|nr:type I 3-dehydroquinate dehydratase [Methanomicrobia archaeon]